MKKSKYKKLCAKLAADPRSDGAKTLLRKKAKEEARQMEYHRAAVCCLGKNQPEIHRALIAAAEASQGLINMYDSLLGLSVKEHA